MNPLLELLTALTLVAVALVGLVLGLTLREDVRRLRERLDRLEREAAQRGAGLALEPPPLPPGQELPPPIPIDRPADEEVVATATEPRNAPISLEEVVGGLWLQSAGSVLLLLGMFFLILWSYTTGRIGGGPLVASGAALGVAFAWRGDRLARAVPAFGHALVGVGLGIVWLSVYLGHFRLHAIVPGAAFALLALVSLGTVVVGLLYRAQSVAALGVLGAFLPQLAAAAVPLAGFRLSPAALLAHSAIVDAVVFVLAGRAAWPSLQIGALGLTTLLWLASFGGGEVTWPVEIGLGALYAALGMAALPRLVRAPQRVRGADLAAIALAPLGALLVSWPFLRHVSDAAAAATFAGQAAVWLGAAAWVGRRREEEDVWRALIAAVTVFLAAALARAAGSERTPLAWCAEALALVALGWGRRGAWLRACGHGIGLVGAAWLLARLVADSGWRAGAPPIVHAAGLRNAVSLALVACLAGLLGTRGERLPESERWTVRLWTLIANLGWLLFEARESQHLALALGGARGGLDGSTLGAVFTSAAWLAHAIVLFALGWRRDSAFLRWLGLGLFGVTAIKFLLLDLRRAETFWRFLVAVAVGLALLGVSYVYQRHARANRPAGGR